MRCIIVTGGPLKDEAAELIKKLSREDEDTVTIACDGGCDILARHDIVPDIVVGDMDSISDAGLEFINSRNVFTEKYPVEKDWTDSEIALSKAEDAEVFLITPFAGRFDHTIANIQLALRFKAEGGKITVTDGITYCYPLSGEDSVSIDVSSFGEPLSVSLVPWDFSEPVRGVTTEGLYYPLDGQDLTAGYTFSFSNHPVEKTGKISINIRSGLLLVTVTFAN
jgi:thiamine pyrophosphokinase